MMAYLKAETFSWFWFPYIKICYVWNIITGSLAVCRLATNYMTDTVSLSAKTAQPAIKYTPEVISLVWNMKFSVLLDIHKEKSNNVSKFYYSLLIWNSTCFGRYTAHYQEPKTALAASGFSYVEGWWTCSWWTLSGTLCPPTTRLTTFQVWKTRGCQCSFGFWWWAVFRPKHVELHINME
jgi:hypothetical protein